MRRPTKGRVWTAPICTLAAIAGLISFTSSALAKDGRARAEPAPQSGDMVGEAEAFFDEWFIDDKDGDLDLSKLLAHGGFIPVPIIITEPAVDGGYGFVAQFISMPDNDPTKMTRRMAGGVKTGNGSYGAGYFQSGHAFDDRIRYKFGMGTGKITLDAHPSFLPSGLEYTNDYDYGVLGSMLVRLDDERFSLGPIFDFRKLNSTVHFIGGLPANLAPDFNKELHTGALGIGLHFDNRDNAITPTEGFNAYFEPKFNSGLFGSDRDFQSYEANVYGFKKLSDDWRVAAKLELDASRGDFPAYFAPAINLRGLQAQSYQGSTVISTEIEVTRQLSDRWSVLAFGGFGSSDAGERRVFDDTDGIVTGGVGFRYRIARLAGMDAGGDIAFGPDGPILYLQVGHAWSFGMD